METFNNLFLLLKAAENLRKTGEYTESERTCSHIITGLTEATYNDTQSDCQNMYECKYFKYLDLPGSLNAWKAINSLKPTSYMHSLYLQWIVFYSHQSWFANLNSPESCWYLFMSSWNICFLPLLDIILNHLENPIWINVQLLNHEISNFFLSEYNLFGTNKKYFNFQMWLQCALPQLTFYGCTWVLV